MGLRWRTIVLTLVLSLGAGLLGAEIGIRRTLEAYPGPISGGVQWAIKKAIHGGLELSETEQQAVAMLEKTHAARRAELSAQLKQASLEFLEALQRDPLRGAAVIAAEDRMYAASRASHAEAFAYVQDIRSVLRPGQQALFDKKVRDAVAVVVQAVN